MKKLAILLFKKKPAVTILPDGIVVTNKRIILCKPKNLGLSMELIDYDWNDVEATFVKEEILGAEFTFSTKSNLSYTIDYLPKNQAQKLSSFAKERIDLIKNPTLNVSNINDALAEDIAFEEVNEEEIQEIETEEVTSFAEIVPQIQPNFVVEDQDYKAEPTVKDEKSLADLSQDELFNKLQNYKKLLDNGLILQGEYDRLKNEVLKYL